MLYIGDGGKQVTALLSLAAAASSDGGESHVCGIVDLPQYLALTADSSVVSHLLCIKDGVAVFLPSLKRFCS